MKLTALSTIALFVSLINGQTPPTNIPEAEPGAILTVQASILIDAPIETAWNALLDFPSYAEWNPFVRQASRYTIKEAFMNLIEGISRSMEVANAAFIPTTDQTPQENLRLIIQAQIPPLPSPVDANTPPNVLHSQVSFENITTIDAFAYRAAWRQIMIPTPLLGAERWQALSVYEGKTYYESREDFYGPLGYVLDTFFASGLQEGFDAQAAAFKGRVESLV